jgi:hypothetical protein
MGRREAGRAAVSALAQVRLWGNERPGEEP